MKFLVDESVSPLVAAGLREYGHDALHVRDSLGTGADDTDILQDAQRGGRVVVTQDRDFGTLLHTPGFPRASVVLLRVRDGRPTTHVAVMLRVVELAASELVAGALIAVDDSSVRVRLLPAAPT